MDRCFVSSNKATQILGVHANTLRTWESKGIIEPGGARRYNVNAL